MPVNETLWSVDDLASYLGIPRATVYVWSSRGIGPRGVRVGRYLRFRRADVEAWLDQAQREREGWGTARSPVIRRISDGRSGR
jgi:excisionase family DNA binding protein